MELLSAGGLMTARLATGSVGTGSLVAVAGLAGKSPSAPDSRSASLRPPAGSPSGLPVLRSGPAGSSAPSAPGRTAPPDPAGTADSPTSPSSLGGGAGRIGSRSAPRIAAGTSTVKSAPIACATDLPLDQAPDSGYNFLCTQGGAPVTWPKGQLLFYEAGLSAAQEAALAVAVVQWAGAARFQVSWTASPAAADVTVTGAALGAGQVGYVEDGYTTVSYRCNPACAYSSAQVELSSTAPLLQTDWVATILHELGHVAGLNHVARIGEVMYPYLTPRSPVAYTPGDLQGLALLAAHRAG